MPHQKKKILFIVNPISGTGKQQKVMYYIDKYLDKTQYDHTIKYTEKPKHAKEITQTLSEKFDVIAAVGGDGSVNEIGSTLINHSTTLAIVPVGSGNGLALHLGISTKLKKAITIINQGKTTSIDTVKVNDTYFLGTGGLGFDALIAKKFAAAPTRGFLTYVKIICQVYFNYKENNYQLMVDGKTIDKKALLLTIANSNQYGNNAFISPNSVIDDGYFRFIILEKFSWLYIPEFIYRIFNKSFTQFKFVTEIKGKQATITTSQTSMHMDGEPTEVKSPISFKVIPQSLKIITP